MRTQRLHLGHVDFLDIGEMRNPPLGVLHLFSDLAPQPDDLDLVHALAPHETATAPGRSAVRKEPIEIGMRDAPARTGSVDKLQLDPKLKGPLPHGRRRKWLVSGHPWHRKSRSRRCICGADHPRGRCGLCRLDFRCRWLSLGRNSDALCLRHVACPLDLEFDDGRTNNGHGTGLAMQRHHTPLDWRRHLDRRLVRHHVDEVLVLVDKVTHLHVPGHDLGFRRSLANIRQLENKCAHARQSSSARRMASPMRLGPGKYCHSNACG